MSRPLRITAGFLLAAALMASCRSPVPVWNPDGKTMTDLRTLRQRGAKSVLLARGVVLYADDIRFTDKRKRTGAATGRVFLDVEPAVRYEWMLEHGYAGRATFDTKRDVVILEDMPMLEREMMTIIATAPYTTIEVRWDDRLAQVNLRGPTRTDFSKSHAIPAGIHFPKAKLPPQPARPTLPARGFGKH